MSEIEPDGGGGCGRGGRRMGGCGSSVGDSADAALMAGRRWEVSQRWRARCLGGAVVVVKPC